MAKNSKSLYRDLQNRTFVLTELEAEERALVAECQKSASENTDWGRYTNFWIPRAEKLLKQSGMSRREMIASDLWQILQDIGARLQIAQVTAQAPDYRDELATIIRSQFSTRREFCDQTGLSEDLLSHVLAHRKHLAIDTLAEALGKIGYTIHLVPEAN